MSTHSDPVFGNLDPDDHGYWTTNLAHGDRQIRADLNIDGDINPEQVGKLSKKLEDIATLEDIGVSRASLITVKTLEVLFIAVFAVLIAGALYAAALSSASWLLRLAL